ncbi:MAG: flavoprotein-like protein [Olpidium bornovanus]|uniref:Flavoprotein-like protein n=1 Tax=Olpidium bornovanus TaxID=278681 RepID=A0A8H7ZT42_9FUNG|nr:MAG: flavoprotein-like protein [Olpidium bornovanus]
MPEPIEAQHKGAGFLSFNGVDVVVALAVVGFAAAYFYKDELSVWISSLSSGRSISAASPVKSSPEKTKEEENKAEEECSRDIATRMKKADKNAVFFYGSQTGTAEDFAGRLAKEGATKYSLKTMTADLDHYDMSFLDQIPPDKIAFFVMATYGEGEPTDNAAAFWEFLVNTEEPKFSRHGDQGEDAEGNPLKNLHYVVYGLGNSTYEHYNAVGKKVAARLSELGATRVSLDGFGNDDGNLEDEFMQWKENMWPDVAKFMGVAATENADDAQ